MTVGIRSRGGTTLFVTKTYCNIASQSAEKANRNGAPTHIMLTRSRTTDISRRAVLDTLELLENILVNVPLLSLLDMRRVCRGWNALLLTSPRIQRKLFLAPERQPQKWVVNKLAKTVMVYQEEHKTRTWTKHHGSVVVAKINPLLLTDKSEEEKDVLEYVRRYEHCETLRLALRPDLKLVGANNLIHRMYVCQPPCVKLEMNIEYNHQRPRRKNSRYFAGKARIVVRNRDGVTLGDVLKGFLDEVGPGTMAHPSSGYAIRIDRSMVWCIGVIFPSEKEMVTAEANAARDIQAGAKVEAEANAMGLYGVS